MTFPNKITKAKNCKLVWVKIILSMGDGVLICEMHRSSKLVDSSGCPALQESVRCRCSVLYVQEWACWLYIECRVLVFLFSFLYRPAVCLVSLYKLSGGLCLKAERPLSPGPPAGAVTGEPSKWMSKTNLGGRKEDGVWELGRCFHALRRIYWTGGLCKCIVL